MITKVKTNTSNYRKLAITQWEQSFAKERACKNHVFDTCCRAKNCQHKKLQQTNLGQRRDDWVAFLHTHPKIDNYSRRSERSNWQASSISQTSSHFYSWIWIIWENTDGSSLICNVCHHKNTNKAAQVCTVHCTEYKIFQMYKTFLINKKQAWQTFQRPCYHFIF